MKSNINKLIIVGLKAVLYVLLGYTFFEVFALQNVGLNYISRTLGTTIMTFAVVGILMLTVYGNFEIGKKKSKPIIFSTTVAVMFTDFVSYLQLMIMNTNPNNNHSFRLEQLDLLLIVLLIQIIAIIIFAYLGNWIYFKINDPVNALIIYDGNHPEVSVRKIQRYISRFKLQYRVIDTIDASQCDLGKYVDKVDYVIFSDLPESVRKPLVDVCYEHAINFTFAPSITDVIQLSGEHITFDDKPMVDVNVSGLTMEQRFFKRVLDIVAALAGIVISSPIWIVSAIAIKLGDGGKILFTQDRYTIDGKIFKVYKFRTMKENVENFSSTENDDRITKVGRVLRKIRMDELPQLINILNGDMSLVGPRPEMTENVDKYESELPEFRYRLRVKAGLTGIAQIEGKYNTSPYDKLLMDLVYIENYSVWSDIRLILRTVIVLFKSDSTEGFESND